MESNNKNGSRIDYGIILCILLLAIIGLVSLYSTTVLMQDGSMRMTILQFIWYIIGISTAAVIMLFDSEQLWKITDYLYWAGIIALVATLFLYDRSLAVSTGAKSWIKIPVIHFTLQPSEFVKIPYILMLAKGVTLHNSKNIARTVQSDFLLLGKLLLYSVLPFVLLMAQNDLGTTLVYAAILAGIILLSGFQWKILLPIVIIVSSLGIGILVLAVYNPDFLIETLGVGQYQILRIHTWLDPYQDTTASSYQVTQAFKAIGSGGVFGKGLGVSEVYVPVRESDMIFTTITENFGFIGGSFLIFIYFVLVYNMIKIVYDTKNEFYAYIATGVIMMIVFHVLENVGMNIGLLPVTGIPLPFVSQGGSALLGNMMGVGLLMSMRFHHRSYIFSGEGEEFHSGVK
ncbi:rod shape determining protein RodA [Atopostipes suicloacalis DSM 15692]|uniref:Rod shape determining protein RodA n=1 Tax=Atopostipes suicloacalis DSM 15692 TaxID=1121025 RepID=A0A1M4W7M4_9LACT|nr:FtsW/RodA/SpoVE family cell cycle protein [Atopostipes suicloacalis]SHE77103.1 rod shape determining protein RodA [Atopostipes suicloacalis DSM 15692]